MRGAEAVLDECEIIGMKALVKRRISKKYRLREIDEKLRKERTRSEARLLHKAKIAGVGCPTVLQVDDFEIFMSFLDGKRPDMDAAECKEAGEILAKLHEADIIHGDYTPANLISDGKISVIDFGLGFVSKGIEDKAVDVFTMMRAVDEKDAFIDGYKAYSKSDSVLKRLKKVEQRVRYAF